MSWNLSVQYVNRKRYNYWLYVFKNYNLVILLDLNYNNIQSAAIKIMRQHIEHIENIFVLRPNNITYHIKNAKNSN